MIGKMNGFMDKHSLKVGLIVSAICGMLVHVLATSKNWTIVHAVTLAVLVACYGVFIWAVAAMTSKEWPKARLAVNVISGVALHFGACLGVSFGNSPAIWTGRAIFIVAIVLCIVTERWDRIFKRKEDVSHD